ncbi:MAG: hypothetical protein WBP94_02415 [Rhodomicrobiaceae bacterium]
MTNPFSTHNGGLNAPASRVVPITPDDDNDLPEGACRALLVGTAGTADLIDASGAERTGVPLQQGYNPIGALRVKTGGSATNLWALY